VIWTSAAIANHKKVAILITFLFPDFRQLWSSAEGGEVDLARCCERRGAWQHGVAQVRRCGVRPLWRHRKVRGAVEAVFRVRCQNGQIAKSFQNFIGKTHLKKIFLDGACTAKYFIKLCLFAKQPVATKEEMTRGSV
jgi:hypothetical protein